MPDLLIDLFFVAVGSALGGPARFLISGLVARRFGETFPWGTMTVNVTGALAIGVLAAVLPTGGDAWAGAWPMFVTGFLGCYTTVSSFSLQTLGLLRDGQVGWALANVVLSVVIGLSAAGLGYYWAGGFAGVA